MPYFTSSLKKAVAFTIAATNVLVEASGNNTTHTSTTSDLALKQGAVSGLFWLLVGIVAVGATYAAYERFGPINCSFNLNCNFKFSRAQKPEATERSTLLGSASSSSSSPSSSNLEAVEFKNLEEGKNGHSLVQTG